jgi:hypothetical protein
LSAAEQRHAQAQQQTVNHHVAAVYGDRMPQVGPVVKGDQRAEDLVIPKAPSAEIEETPPPISVPSACSLVLCPT